MSSSARVYIYGMSFSLHIHLCMYVQHGAGAEGENASGVAVIGADGDFDDGLGGIPPHILQQIQQEQQAEGMDEDGQYDWTQPRQGNGVDFLLGFFMGLFLGYLSLIWLWPRGVPRMQKAVRDGVCVCVCVIAMICAWTYVYILSYTFRVLCSASRQR